MRGLRDAYARAEGFEQSLRSRIGRAAAGRTGRARAAAPDHDQRVAGRGAGSRWLALAAAVVLSLAAGVLGYRYLDQRDLGEMSIAHLPHEPQASDRARRTYPVDEVRAAFALRGALAAAPARVDYVQQLPRRREPRRCTWSCSATRARSR
jgi:hypothetical protein